ncbi:MAG: RNA polymerase factor sigma-54 [Candidatus Aureabacteria bacterium]|nr:RNA polymerase factor sigma-54 [Candidatus Auribacterota bacterium]
MALRLEQVLKMSQQLVMSPQMQQAIKILQLPLMELRATVQEELNTNPVLEETQKEEGSIDTTIENITQTVDKKEPDDGTNDTFKEEFEKLKKLDEEWRDYYHQTHSIRKFTSEDEEKRRFFQNSITVGETLHDHLLKQLRMTITDPKEINLGEHIIGNIDNNGYLRTTVEETSEKNNIDTGVVDRVLSIIQKFHPLGVGARDLKECLLLQMERVEDNHIFVRKIVENHLDDLAKKRYPQIKRKLKISINDIKKAAEFIATLEPKPGRIFSQEHSQYITPDLLVEKNNQTGRYEIVLNDDRIPHLRINTTYSQLLESKDIPQQTKEYIKDKIKSGMWLIKNIYQRQQTIFRITEQIVKVQKRFFDDGIAYLKPLTMQEVADAILIRDKNGEEKHPHESTVSRAVANKYAQTPRGLFQLKYFFTSRIRTENGEDASSRSIKQKIKDIIDNENKSKPLSDQEIIDLLKEQNIMIARRTVAKYRKELNILPSHMRKEY